MKENRWWERWKPKPKVLRDRSGEAQAKKYFEQLAREKARRDAFIRWQNGE